MTPAQRFDKLSLALLGVYETNREDDLVHENIAAAFIAICDAAANVRDQATEQRCLTMAMVWDPEMARIYERARFSSDLLN